MLSVISSIFVIFNSYLYCRIVSSYRDQVIVAFGTMTCLLISLVYSNFNWKYTRSFDIIFLIAYATAGIALVLIFGYI